MIFPWSEVSRYSDRAASMSIRKFSAARVKWRAFRGRNALVSVVAGTICSVDRTGQGGKDCET